MLRDGHPLDGPADFRAGVGGRNRGRLGRGGGTDRQKRDHRDQPNVDATRHG